MHYANFKKSVVHKNSTICYYNTVYLLQVNKKNSNLYLILEAYDMISISTQYRETCIASSLYNKPTLKQSPSASFVYSDIMQPHASINLLAQGWLEYIARKVSL